MIISATLNRGMYIICGMILFISFASAIQLDDELTSPLSISFQPPANRVHIGRPLKIRCQLSATNDDERSSEDSVDMSRLSMFLYCPVVHKGAFCFHNCKSVCTGQNPADCPYNDDLKSVKCKQVTTHDGHMTYEYTIEELSSKWLGNSDTSSTSQTGFYCKLGSHRTTEVRLVESMELITESATTTSTLATTKPSTTTSTTTTTTPAKTTTTPTTTKSERIVPVSDSRDFRSSAFLREFLIVGAIVIVGLSVILNLFCCIRCILIRQYSKSKGRAHMQHLFCMKEEIQNARIVHKFRDKRNAYANTNRMQQNEICLQNTDSRHFVDAYGQPMFVSRELMVSPGSQNLAPSDTTSAGPDSHFRCLQDGRLISGPQSTIMPYVVVPRMMEERSSKTNSIVIPSNINGLPVFTTSAQDPNIIYAVNHYAQQQPPVSAFQQPFVLHAKHSGSEGPGSMFGSISNPDQSATENYQPSSSGISTLQNSQSAQLMEDAPKVVFRSDPPVIGVAGVVPATSLHSVDSSAPQMMVPVIIGQSTTNTASSQYNPIFQHRGIHSDGGTLPRKLMKTANQTDNGSNPSKGNTIINGEPTVQINGL